MSDNTVTSANIHQSVSISIKLMSGDLIPLEIDSGITCSEFHQIAVTSLDKQNPLVGSDCMSFMPVTLTRMAKVDDDVEGSEIKYNAFFFSFTIQFVIYKLFITYNSNQYVLNILITRFSQMIKVK
jgi:hypothetical protein